MTVNTRMPNPGLSANELDENLPHFSNIGGV